MTKQNVTLFAMFLSASVLSMCFVLIVAHKAQGIIFDYRLADFGARCLIKRCDLYSQPAMQQFYLANGGERLSQSDGVTNYLASFQVYPPTAEPFFAALALLPWKAAYITWISLGLVLMTIAALLMWDAARFHAPSLSFYLGCFVLVNSGALLAGGNPAGIAVALCIISAWCMYRDQFGAFGALCLASSLAIKPHDAGFIWLYFFLLGNTYRKRALQSLLAVAILTSVSVAWILQVSPHWISGLRSNLAALATNGSCNDPGGSSAISMVNLQTVWAYFRNEPRFYNLLSYAIVAPLLIMCLLQTVRSDRRQKNIWLGLGTISVLSLLPLYHRPHDAKLLLLTVPACAIMWSEGGIRRWMALLFTGAGIVATSEIPLIFLQIVSVPQGPGLKDRALAFFTTRSAPLVLLAEAVFYLWAYFQHNSNQRVLDSRSQLSNLVQSLPS